MLGWRRGHTDRIALLIERHHNLPRLQMQHRPAYARCISINVVADHRPAHGGAMHAQLVRPPRERLEREPGFVVGLPATFQVVEAGWPAGSKASSTSARVVQTAQRQIDAAFFGVRPALDDRPIGLARYPTRLNNLPRSASAARWRPSAGSRKCRGRGRWASAGARQAKTQRAEIVFRLSPPFGPMHGEACGFVDDQHQGVAVEQTA